LQKGKKKMRKWPNEGKPNLLRGKKSKTKADLEDVGEAAANEDAAEVTGGGLVTAGEEEVAGEAAEEAKAEAETGESMDQMTTMIATRNKASLRKRKSRTSRNLEANPLRSLSLPSQPLLRTHSIYWLRSDGFIFIFVQQKLATIVRTTREKMI